MAHFSGYQFIGTILCIQHWCRCNNKRIINPSITSSCKKLGSGLFGPFGQFIIYNCIPYLLSQHLFMQYSFLLVFYLFTILVLWYGLIPWPGINIICKHSMNKWALPKRWNQLDLIISRVLKCQFWSLIIICLHINHTIYRENQLTLFCNVFCSSGFLWQFSLDTIQHSAGWRTPPEHSPIVCLSNPKQSRRWVVKKFK